MGGTCLPIILLCGKVQDITINQSETIEFFFHQNSYDNVGIINWTWTFEYNSTNQTLFHAIHFSSLPSFRFHMPGNYSVSIIVYDEAGNWAVDMLNITVLDLSPPKEPEIDYDNDTEGDSDDDGYNDTYEREMGSDPLNEDSTPLDWDGDGWNNSIEIETDADPHDHSSIPRDQDRDGIPDSLDPDRDGDKVANVDDAYPDDPNSWEDDTVSDKEGDRSIFVWVGLIMFAFIAGLFGIVIYVVRKKGIEEDEESETDDLGRVGKEE